MTVAKNTDSQTGRGTGREPMTPTDRVVEKMARAICRQHGRDPDLVKRDAYPGPAPGWHWFEADAQAAITAIPELRALVEAAVIFDAVWQGEDWSPADPLFIEASDRLQQSALSLARSLSEEGRV